MTGFTGALERLFGFSFEELRATERFVLASAAPGRGGITTFTGEKLIDEWVEGEVAEGREVYYTVTTQVGADSWGPKERAKEVSAGRTGFLWVDVDIASGDAHKATNLPTTPERALAAVAKALPMFPVTAVVHSGNGLHCYWRLDEPVELESEEERFEFKRTVRLFQSAIREEFDALGWKLDSTFDLARLMRLPGTRNFKGGAPGKPVEFLEETDSEITLGRLREFLDSLPFLTDEEQTRRGLKRSVISDDRPEEARALIGDLGVVFSGQRGMDDSRIEPLLVALDVGRTGVRRALTHDKRLLKPGSDESTSGWDFQIAVRSIRAGAKFQQVADLMVRHRAIYGGQDRGDGTRTGTWDQMLDPNKHNSLPRTMLRAAALVGVELSRDDSKRVSLETQNKSLASTAVVQATLERVHTARDAATEPGEEPPPGRIELTDELRGQALSALSRVIECPVTRVLATRDMLSDSPNYYLELEGKDPFKLGRGAGAFGNQVLRNRLMEEVGVVLPRPAKGQPWHPVEELFVALVEEGDDAGERIIRSPEDHMREFLIEYLDGAPKLADAGAVLAHTTQERARSRPVTWRERKGPFEYDGSVHIFFDRMKDAYAETGGPLKFVEIVQALGKLDWKKKRLRITDPSEKDAETYRLRVWSCPVASA